MSNQMVMALLSATCMSLTLGTALAQSAVAPTEQTAPAAMSTASPTADPSAAPTSGVATPAQAVASVEPEALKQTIPAAYLLGSARLPDQTIADWLANPKMMLEANPAGGLAMVNYVKSLAGSENRTPSVLVQLSKQSETTPAQQAAIGTGLARAAQTGQAIAPEYAAYILETVASSQSPRLIAAFQAALSQTATAALGTASSSAGGGGGSLGGGGTAGPSGGIGDEPTVVAQSVDSFSISRGSASFDDGDTITFQSQSN